MTKEHKDQSFFGTTTVGEKGQVVIPAEAREAMSVEKGEKLLVFGKGLGKECDMLVFTKLSNVERFATHLSRRLDAIRDILDRTK